MFWLSESFKKHEYGVAVVWLIANNGFKIGSRPISRKKIMEVTIPKVCRVIPDPTVPLALRLQAHLLYGAALIHKRQCHYTLIDLEKLKKRMIQSLKGGDEITLDEDDEKRNKRSRIELDGDPFFDVDLALRLPKFPRLDGTPSLDGPSGSSSRIKTYGKENARDGDTDSHISLDEDFLLSDMLDEEFELDKSELGYFANPANLPFNPKINLDESHLKNKGKTRPSSPFGFGEDEIIPSFEEEVWGIEIDDDGNVRIRDDPKPADEEEAPVAEDELFVEQKPLTDDPPLSAGQHELPTLWKAEYQLSVVPAHRLLEAQQEAQQEAEREAAQANDALPVLSDELFAPQTQEEVDRYDLPLDSPRSRSHQPQRAEDVYEIELANQFHIRDSRHPHNYEEMDDETTLSLAQFQEWEDNYTERTDRHNLEKHLRKRPPPGHTKKHSRFLIFGRGLNNVGKGEIGLLSPLAEVFAAENLERLTFGEPLPPIDPPAPRRRRAAEAIDSNDENVSDRHVNARKSKKAKSNDEEQKQSSDVAITSDAMDLDLVDQNVEDPRGAVPESELGRDAGSALPDLPSDNPWIPSSSIKAAGGRPGPSSQLGTSPSLGSRGRGTHLASDIERYSDRPQFSSDPFGPFNEEADIVMSDAAAAPRGVPFVSGPPDGNDQDFFDQVEEATADGGSPWVGFSDLLPPASTTRAQATMVFFQVLRLVTKGAMRVEQDGAEGVGPRGEIRVAVVGRGAGAGSASNE